MTQLTKYLFLMLCTFFSVNGFAEVIWGSASLNPIQVTVQNIKPNLNYSDVLSIDENGLLDNSNKVKVDFSDRESMFPEMVLDTAEIQLINGKYAIKGCAGFNEDCDFVSLTQKEVNDLVESTNPNIVSALYMFNKDITQSNMTGRTATIYFKSNRTNNTYVELANYRIDIPRMINCIGRMDSNIWDLGKISPASFSVPKQIKIAAIGGKRSVVRFTGPDLVNSVLTMRDGDKIGPSIEFKGEEWSQCTDNANTICGTIGTLAQSANIFKFNVNGINAEPGKYTSFLTSTIDCN